MVVAAYLMASRGLSRDEALAFLRSQRPGVRPNPPFMRLLLEWEQALRKGDIQHRPEPGHQRLVRQRRLQPLTPSLTVALNPTSESVAVRVQSPGVIKVKAARKRWAPWSAAVKV